MPSSQLVRIGAYQFGQFQALLSEHLQGKSCIQIRIIQAATYQLSILVMFHQAVVGVAGESQGTQAQRIDRRQLQQLKTRLRGAQVGNVKFNQVMAQQVIRSDCQLIQL